MREITYIDLFAGLGGMRLGVEQALNTFNLKGKCLLTSEIKKSAIQAYNVNFNESVDSLDVCGITSSLIKEDVDILLAGFSCTPFSTAGKREGFLDEKRGGLFYEVSRIIKEIKPQSFILENVEGLLTHNREKGAEIGSTLKYILDDLKSVGYDVEYHLISASDYGLAQYRKRVYILGFIGEKIEYKVKKQKCGKLKDVLEWQPIDKEFTQRVLSALKRQGLDLEYLKGKAIRNRRLGDKSIHSWDLGLKGFVTPRQRELLRVLIKLRRQKERGIQKGIYKKDGVGVTLKELQESVACDSEDVTSLEKQGYIKKVYIKTEKGSFELYDIKGGTLSHRYTRFVSEEDTCYTLLATDMHKIGVVGRGGIRGLTVREGLRLSGYPKEYKLNMVSKRQAYDLIGNTVAVPVVKDIAMCVLEKIRKKGD